MDFKQLRTFSVVAKTQNFTRAAEILNYSQSTVSGQIQALEHDLGIPLFDRLGRGVLLTEEGRRILVYVENLSRIEEEIRAIAQGQDEPAGSLIVGAPESIIAYRLPEVLLKFRALYPKVQLKFAPGSCSEHRTALRLGEIDVAILLEAPIDTDHLITECLMEESIVLVSAPTHPLAQMDKISDSDLADQVFIMVESTQGGWSYREMFENTMILSHIYPSDRLEFSSVEAVKQCAVSGLGIALLPQMTVENEVREKKLAMLHRPSIRLSTHLAWNQQRWISSSMQAFIDVIRQFKAPMRSAKMSRSTRSNV